QELEAFYTQTGGYYPVGLSLAQQNNAEESIYLVAGYPVYKQGEQIIRSGIIRGSGWKTNLTANFGPLNKIKVDSLDSEPLAHPGMSGGPIINRYGEVIGLAIEKPN